jgi:hypothetical protein
MIALTNGNRSTFRYELRLWDRSARLSVRLTFAPALVNCENARRFFLAAIVERLLFLLKASLLCVISVDSGRPVLAADWLLNRSRIVSRRR